jgi:diamine N-acetyltransferase
MYILQDGNKLILRAVEPGDIDDLLMIENDPDIWAISNTHAPYSRFQIEQYVFNAPNEIQTNHQLRLIAGYFRENEETITIGMVDFFDVDMINRRAGIGILVRKEFRNMGFARILLDMATDYSFNVLNLHQLHCSISSENTASLRLFENAGFIACGLRRDWVLRNGTWTDEKLYQLIHEKN